MYSYSKRSLFKSVVVIVFIDIVELCSLLSAKFCFDNFIDNVEQSHESEGETAYSTSLLILTGIWMWWW